MLTAINWTWMCCASGVTKPLWLNYTLPMTPDGSHSGRCADSHQICQQKCGSVSGSRFTECHQICQQKWWGEFLPADLLTETKSTSRNSVGVFLPADILTVTKCTNRNRALFQLTDLLIVIKFANRNGRGAFLPADLLTVTRPDSINVQGNSASRFTDYQLNLPADLFPLQFLYQRVCFNAIFLYFSPFKYMYTVSSAKSVLFTQKSN